ncbi:polycystic kidney disease protein 1-like [Homalodisca vitripennis]|nr:polycystic kidney disease protein 1-like [Homalodisca vitripennis]
MYSGIAYSCSTNIEIIGLPGTHDEDIYYCLQKIAHAIIDPFKRENFSIAHRLRLYSKKHVHPPIIAQFVSRKLRQEWLKTARRTRNLNASDIDSALNYSPVFINEHLTAHNKAILRRARRLQREKKISFAGFFNGQILVKVAEGAETERVTALADLDKFNK